jgi:hypothetical protein
LVSEKKKGVREIPDAFSEEPYLWIYGCVARLRIVPSTLLRMLKVLPERVP